MDTGDTSNQNGNGKHDPEKFPTQSSSVPSKEGAPVELSSEEKSAGTPDEPLVVVDSEVPRARLSANQLAFLQALATEAGNVSGAERRCHLTRANHYRWMGETDSEGNPTPTALAYRQLVESIHNEACDEVDAEIRRRGIKGVEEPVFYQGEVCGHVQKFSDLLLIFRAKALMPEKYRERHEVTGANGAPLHPSKVSVSVQVSYADALTTLTDEELESHNAIAAKLLARSGRPASPGTN